MDNDNKLYDVMILIKPKDDKGGNAVSGAGVLKGPLAVKEKLTKHPFK